MQKIPVVFIFIPAFCLSGFYMTLRRMGKKKEAIKALELVTGKQEIIENHDYFNLSDFTRTK
jgi:hypothetical protein